MKIVKVSPTNIYKITFSDFVIIWPYLTKRKYVNFVLFYINLNLSYKTDDIIEFVTSLLFSPHFNCSMLELMVFITIFH